MSGFGVGLPGWSGEGEEGRSTRRRTVSEGDIRHGYGTERGVDEEREGEAIVLTGSRWRWLKKKLLGVVNWTPK